MSEATEADRYLLKRIADGDATAWEQLVSRYHGRLLSFARSRMRRDADAEDLVQETFLQFLQQRSRYDPDRSLETYLFTILRRRLIDAFRGKASHVCFLHDTLSGDQDGGSDRGIAGSRELSASFYVRRDEQRDQAKAALAAALTELISRYKSADRFKELRLVEMLFYAQLRNKDIARLMEMDEKAVALVKHRCLNQIAQSVSQALHAQPLAEPEEAASILTEVWEEQRLTCPKRSTLGKYLLKTLDDRWQQYIHFHVDTLGCQFCSANIDDLKRQTQQQPKAFYDRLMQSTIGFFRRP